MEPGPSSTGEKTKSKRKRGRTRCLSLNNLKPGERLEIVRDNYGQPVGKHVSKLQRYLGVLARDGHMFPLDILDWHAMPESMKENAWQTTLVKFKIPSTLKQVVLQSTGRKWSDYKCKLKTKFYDKYKDDATRCANRPSEVLEAQWNSLVAFWNSEEGQSRSLRNKANRAQHTMTHTAGTKSIACMRYDEKLKSSTNTEPSRATLFLMTHKPNDAVTAEKIDKIKELMSKLPEGSQDITGRNDVLSQVMGPDRHGRVRGVGFGPTPSKLFASSSENAFSNSAEVRKLKEKLESLEQQQIKRDAEVQGLKELVIALMKKVDKQHNQPASNHCPQQQP